MFSRFLIWLRDLPGAFFRWCVRAFWAVVAFIRDLPRLMKEAILALCRAVRDLVLLLVASVVGLCQKFSRALSKVFKWRVDTDLFKIPNDKFTIPKRGRTVALFSRQMASMTQGGIPLLQSLDVLGDQEDDERMAYVSKRLAGKLGQGFSLSKATTEFPLVFPPIFSHLLKAGEGTGRIVEVINRLADLLEKEEDLLKQVKGALSYPIFVMGLTFVLTVGLFSTVLPGFADFYKDFDVPLPFVTDLLMTITEWIQTPWFWIAFVVIVGGLFQFTKVSWKILERRLVMYQALLWLPLVGPIIRFSSLARFCWVMELTQDAGMDLMRSVKLACLASGSPLLEVDANRMIKGVTEGEYLSDLMKQRADLHPHLLQQMVMMGEETSQYSQAFGRAGSWFEQEVQGRVETFQAALEPILMGLISTIVGTIVLSVFLPLYGLLDKLGV